jgi:glycerol-3-phosphate dehydrogenase
VMPITQGVCAVLEGARLEDLVAQLMRRDPTLE